MNISIFNTFDNQGGAAIAARRLCKGLIRLGQDAVMMVRNKTIRRPYIFKVSTKSPEYESEKKIFQQIQQREIDQNRTERSNTWFSLPYPGYDLSRAQIIANADIINLHWVAGFQSTETVSQLLKTGKPVVWTLHDENPYTGGCHYTAGCTKYREKCRDCLQLKDNQYQIPFHNLKNKINLWDSNLTIVTPSQWLAQCAKKSRIFKDLRVEVIPNSLETDIFKPTAKHLAKKKMGMDVQAFTLLFGAFTDYEKRKGFSKLLDAVKYCLKDQTFKRMARNGRVNILTFGPPQQDLEELDIEIRCTGYVNDDRRLATIYSASDIFVLPSLEDNLPNTMLEAMACGTPVIGFEVGGIPDMVQNGVTGYTAPSFDSKKLGALIPKLLADEAGRNRMSQNCRRLIEEKFKLQDQAENYTALFRDLLTKKTPISQTGKRKAIFPKNRKIILDKWESAVQKDFSEIYRKWALQVLVNQETQIQRLKRQIKSPLRKVRRILREIAKFISHHG